MTEGRLTAAEAEEFTESLAQITTGSWRQISLAVQLGIPATLGLSTREWVEQRIGGYVRLALEERREAVVELTANGHSIREAGDILGVSKSAVQRDQEPVPDGTPEIPDLQERSDPVPDGTPAESEWTEEMARASRLRASRHNLNTVLLMLTSESVTPDRLANDGYADIVHEYEPQALEFAATTMTLLAAMRRSTNG